MKDFSGTELSIGQKVAICLPYYKHLVEGRVEKIGPKMVTCSYYDDNQRLKTTPRYPNQVMVMPITLSEMNEQDD
jgi:hypothetical protein